MYLLSLAGSIDQNRKIAIEALADINEDRNRVEERLKQVSHQGAVATLKEKYFRLLEETIVCRAADNYLCYLTELISSIFKTKPETLRSNEQIRIDKVLGCNTMEELIILIADRKVHELAYQSLTDLNSYLVEKLGLAAFEDKSHERLIVKVILIRNLIVHNRGIITERFRSAVDDLEGAVGSQLDLGVDETFRIVEELTKAAETLDIRAAAKFALPVADFQIVDPFKRLKG